MAVAVLIAAAYGGAMEGVQSTDPERDASVWDFVANLLGAGVFAVGYRWVLARTRFVA
jgi:VanZ family protein